MKQDLDEEGPPTATESPIVDHSRTFSKGWRENLDKVVEDGQGTRLNEDPSILLKEGTERKRHRR